MCPSLVRLLWLHTKKASPIVLYNVARASAVQQPLSWTLPLRAQYHIRLEKEVTIISQVSGEA